MSKKGEPFPYIYSTKLADPKEIFSPNAKHMTRNVIRLPTYTSLLVKASNRASKGKTLGPRQFVKTIGQCIHEGEAKTRYLWSNNHNKKGGFLTSIVGSLNEMEFNVDTEIPSCECVKGVIRDNNHDEYDQYHFISSKDFKPNDEYLEKADASNCDNDPDDDETDDEQIDTEAFANMYSANFPKDPLYKMYLTSITLLWTYILFKLYSKKR